MGKHHICQKHRKHDKCHERHDKCHDKHGKKAKRGVDFSLITELPNALSNTDPAQFGGSIPPDPIIAAGPKSVISMVNNSIVIHCKDTMEQVYLDAADNFWSEFADGTFGLGIDPWLVYDEFSERFFLASLGFTQTGSKIVFAVSKDSNPQGADDFFKYEFISVGVNLDFPKIAVDREALYLIAKDFPFDPNAIAGPSIRAFRKAPLLDGSAGPVINNELVFEKVISFTDNFDVADLEHFYPAQPRPSCNGVEQVLIIMSVIEVLQPNDPIVGGDKVRVFQVENVLGANPTLKFADVTVPPFTAISPRAGLSDAPQPPPIVKPQNEPILGLFNLMGFFYTGVISDNSLWTAMEIFSDDGEFRKIARWFEIDVSEFLSNNQLSLVQAGNADPGGRTNQIFPCINVDKDGNMAIQFTLVGELQYPAIAYTGRLKDDPKGTVRFPLEVPIGGDLYYQVTFGGPRNRWGDYCGLAIDPCDHKTFWLYNEYPFAVDPGNRVLTTVTAEGVGTFDAVPAVYSPVFAEVSGTGGLAEPNDLFVQMLACGPLDNPVVDLSDKVGICRRGGCSFVTKTTNVEAAGAIATVIVSTGDAFAAGGPQTGNFPTVMINNDDGNELISAILASQEPINITIRNEVTAFPATFGSDWTTFIGAFQVNQCGKELNAPQKFNVLPQESNVYSELKQKMDGAIAKRNANMGEAIAKRNTNMEETKKKNAHSFAIAFGHEEVRNK